MNSWTPMVALWIVAGALLLLPCLVFSAEILSAVTGGRRRPLAPAGDRRALAIIVPAHNEAPLIARTLRAIRAQLASTDRLLVVADNCSDDTAAVAARERAEVLTRNDRSRRGKGYALDFAIRHLASSPPEVVIVIDADCEVGAGAIDSLARLCAKTARPVQALYRLRAPRRSNAMLRLKEFACVVKNEARPLGLHRLGLPCQLFGSGMAFLWEHLRRAPLAGGHLVEDLQLGIELARAGSPALLCPQAQISSELPATREGIQSQRARWEHGYLATMLHEGPSLLLASLSRGNWAGVALAADLLVPPLALLLMLIALHWLSSLMLWGFVGARAPLVLSTLSGLMLATSVLLAWRRFGRATVPLAGLLHVCQYVLEKVPLYGRFLGARQREWIRSRRGHEVLTPR